MRFGLSTAPQNTTWDDVLALWRAADDIDVFESAWTFDHFYPIFSDSTGPCLEGWTTLAALAQATTRLRAGVMVTGMVYRHPAVLANMAVTLDILSQGRLELGIGAAWNEEECDAYGIELGTLTERFDRFAEGLEVMHGLLTQETTTFHGRYYSVTDARCEPKSVQEPHPPIVIGGTGERRTIPLVARWADHWNAGRTRGGRGYASDSAGARSIPQRVQRVGQRGRQGRLALRGRPSARPRLRSPRRTGF